MKNDPASLFCTVKRTAQIFAILHLIAIPIILIWWHVESEHAYRALILQRPYKDPVGVTFWMQLYIALSGAIFWAAVAAALGRARAWREKNVNSAEGP